MLHNHLSIFKRYAYPQLSVISPSLPVAWLQACQATGAEHVQQLYSFQHCESEFGTA